MWCHLPLLAPLLGLGVFLVLPLPVAGATYAVILLGSGIIWRKVTDAMAAPVATGAEAMIGRTARVVSWEGQRGQVRCWDGLYRARSERSQLVPGDEVRVAAVEGTTLHVHTPSSDGDQLG